MVISRELHDRFAAAIESGDRGAVLQVLNVHPEIVNSLEWVPPPLHCAILWDQPDIAATLLEYGADLEMLDPDRRTTPLRYAIVYGRTELIRLLVEHGANTGPIETGGSSARELAIEASEGAYEAYDDLPSRQAYAEVLKTLDDLNVD